MKFFSIETVSIISELRTIPSWSSQVVTSHLERWQKIMQNVIVVMNDVGKKCLISLPTEFRQGCLRFGQKA